MVVPVTSSANGAVRSRKLRARLARALALLALAASLGACSSLDWFKNKDELPPDEPADRLYNEGLYLLNTKHDTKKAAKKVRRGRPPASLFGVGAQVADHVVLRLLHGRRL